MADRREIAGLQARRRLAAAQRRRRRLLAAATGTAVIGAGTLAILAIDGGAPAGGPSVAEQLKPSRLVGQLLAAGFEGRNPPEGLREMIERGEVAGVILFDDNLGGRNSIRRLTKQLQAIDRPRGLRDPLLVMVDQEGGQVKRLAGPPHASAERMGAAGAAYAREQGRKTANSLQGVGINVNLAPVLDVARKGGAIDQEHRSFGDRPGRMIRTGVRGFAAAQSKHGVASTAKHFPGLGAAAVNTDVAAQRITLSKRELRRTDERPFGAFASADGELVMLALATYTAFSDRPAAFSRSIATGELRRRVGYEGVSITDALGANAAQAFGDRAEVAFAAAVAGNDLLLYTDWRDARAAHRTLLQRLRSGRLERADLERSVERVLALRSSLPG